MTLLSLIAILILIGLVLWIVDKLLPSDFDPTMRRMIHVAGIVVGLLILLSAFGLLPWLDVPIPRLTR